MRPQEEGIKDYTGSYPHPEGFGGAVVTHNAVLPGLDQKLQELAPQRELAHK